MKQEYEKYLKKMRSILVNENLTNDDKEILSESKNHQNYAQNILNTIAQHNNFEAFKFIITVLKVNAHNIIGMLRFSIEYERDDFTINVFKLYDKIKIDLFSKNELMDIIQDLICNRDHSEQASPLFIYIFKKINEIQPTTEKEYFLRNIFDTVIQNDEVKLINFLEKNMQFDLISSLEIEAMKKIIFNANLNLISYYFSNKKLTEKFDQEVSANEKKIMIAHLIKLVDASYMIGDVHYLEKINSILEIIKLSKIKLFRNIIKKYDSGNKLTKNNNFYYSNQLNTIDIKNLSILMNEWLINSLKIEISTNHPINLFKLNGSNEKIDNKIQNLILLFEKIYLTDPLYNSKNEIIDLVTLSKFNSKDFPGPLNQNIFNCWQFLKESVMLINKKDLNGRLAKYFIAYYFEEYILNNLSLSENVQDFNNNSLSTDYLLYLDKFSELNRLYNRIYVADEEILDDKFPRKSAHPHEIMYFLLPIIKKSEDYLSKIDLYSSQINEFIFSEIVEKIFHPEVKMLSDKSLAFLSDKNCNYKNLSNIDDSEIDNEIRDAFNLECDEYELFLINLSTSFGYNLQLLDCFNHEEINPLKQYFEYIQKYAVKELSKRCNKSKIYESNSEILEISNTSPINSEVRFISYSSCNEDDLLGKREYDSSPTSDTSPKKRFKL